ncbi:MAG: hypothetical protein V1821_01275 [bacterium]
MRCKKCRAWVARSSKFCPRCGLVAKIIPADPKAPKRKLFRSVMIGLITILGVIALVVPIVFALNPKAIDSPFAIVAGLILVFTVLAIVGMLIYKFFSVIVRGLRYSFSHRAFLPIPVAVVVLMLVLGFFWYQKSSSTNFTNSLLLIQDSLTEVAAAKISCDSLLKGKSVPTGYAWSDAQKAAAAEASIIANLNDSSTLDSYKNIATAWAAGVRDAAKAKSACPNLPGDFSISLSEKQANNLIRSAIVKIAVLKEYGDLAIKNKDRVAMRHIAAKLLVERHWLEGLTRYNKQGLFSGLVGRVYAYQVEAPKVCFTAYNGKSFCTPEVIETTTEAYDAATAYAINAKGAEAAWNQAWKDEAELLSEAQRFTGYDLSLALDWNSHALEPSGEVKSGDIEVQPPDRAQQFTDACHELAGTVGGANQSIGFIPTTEGGHVCSYKLGQDNCWNYLTYSGGYYLGGDARCPKRHLLPEELAVEPYRFGEASKPKTGTTVWGVTPVTPATDLSPPPPKVPAAPGETSSDPGEDVNVPGFQEPIIPTPAPVPVTPAPSTPPAPAPKPDYGWRGAYSWTSWSGTCRDERGNVWNSSPDYSYFEVESDNTVCASCGCAAVPDAGNFSLDCVYRQAWGNNYTQIGANFSKATGKATVSGEWHAKKERVTSEFGSTVEPNSTSWCDSTFQAARSF